MATEPTTGANEARTSSWARRPVLSFSIRAVAMLLPAVVAWVVTSRTSHLFWRPDGAIGVAVWIVQLAVVGTVVVVAVERLTRRFLPLAALFSLSLVFPDQAPSRFKAALRAGTIRNLQDRLDEHRRLGVSEPGDVMESIVELVAALGNHERLTRGHTERVRAYADVIAVEMGVSKTDRYLLQWSCLLHDIGKLAVSPAILNKAGKPTDEEWAELRRHPEVGGEIVEPLAPWLGEWRLATSQHHERWDGGGYPLGLAGEEISLAGRIVAVADAYDVITSARSYKRPMSTEAARAELVRCAGHQFDPAVVRAFLKAGLGRTSIALGPLGWLRELTTLSGAGATGASTAAHLASAVVISLAAVAPTALVDASPRTSTTSPIQSSVSADDGPVTPVTLDGDGRGQQPTRPASDVTTTAAVPGSPSDTTPTADPSTTLPPTRTSVPTGTSPAPTGSTLAPPGTTVPAPATTVPRTTPGATTTVLPATTTPAPTTTTPPPAPTTSPPATTTTVPPGSPPNAMNDSGIAALGSATPIMVLANDTDPDGDLVASSLTIVSQPSKGSASVSGNRIIYSPGSSVLLLGSTSLTYRVCDSANRCDTATVTITIVLA